MKQILEKAKENMQKSVDNLLAEYLSIRAINAWSWGASNISNPV